MGQSLWHTGAESARDTIRKIRRQTRKALVKEGAKHVKKGILKKLEPAPRWKSFGTPVKRKLNGKDRQKPRKQTRRRRRRQRGGKFDIQKALSETAIEFHIPS